MNFPQSKLLKREIHQKIHNRGVHKKCRMNPNRIISNYIGLCVYRYKIELNACQRVYKVSHKICLRQISLSAPSFFGGACSGAALRILFSKLSVHSVRNNIFLHLFDGFISPPPWVPTAFYNNNSGTKNTLPYLLLGNDLRKKMRLRTDKELVAQNIIQNKHNAVRLGSPL